jgi:hypothetical protein
VAAAYDRATRTLPTRAPYAAAVIALPEDDGAEVQRQLRQRHPGLAALIIIEPAATRFVDGDDGTLVFRPFDPRRVLGRVFELVLREDGVRPHHSRIAELGITAAKLACLDSRRRAAATTGARGLAQALARQISKTRAMHDGLGAVAAI